MLSGTPKTYIVNNIVEKCFMVVGSRLAQFESSKTNLFQNFILKVCMLKFLLHLRLKYHQKAMHYTDPNIWWEVKFSHPMKRQNFRDVSGQTCNPFLISGTQCDDQKDGQWDEDVQPKKPSGRRESEPEGKVAEAWGKVSWAPKYFTQADARKYQPRKWAEGASK